MITCLKVQSRRSIHCFMLVAVLFVLVSPCAFAEGSDVACNLPQNEIRYQFRATGESESGPAQYRVSVANLENVVVATKPLALDFPRPGSTVRFFYLNPPLDKDVDGTLELIGCLHYTGKDGKAVTAHKQFSNEGGVAPDIKAMFTVSLNHDIGKTLVLILSRTTHAGVLWDVKFFSSANVAKAAGGDGWGEGLFHPVGEQFMLPLGDGSTMADFPYKTRAAVIKRLKTIGYLD